MRATGRWRAAWLALGVAAAGCTTLLGVDKDYHSVEEAEPECTPDGVQCDGNRPQVCDGTGNWLSLPECVDRTCVAGACVGECGPGQQRCEGIAVQGCDAAGQWVDEQECVAGLCVDLACVWAPNCVGVPPTCGPMANESCCASSTVPGGTYNRSNDPAYPATVSQFVLDRFEVTVGRFRSFMEAYPGSKPAAGAGAHPLIAGTGWDPAWDGNLPADQAALKAEVQCDPVYHTWTEAPGDNEILPMNCLSWYTAFAFCAWDGGRLPTEAEWNYAAAGGGEQREYPWSSPASLMAIDSTYAVYWCVGDGQTGNCSFEDILAVGSRSVKGDGRWAHADLAGSMWEWTLDGYDDYQAPCDNCVSLSPGAVRVIRGGGWGSDVPELLSAYRYSFDSSELNVNVSVRCARTP